MNEPDHVSSAREKAARIVALAERADVLIPDFRAVIDEIAELESALALAVVKTGRSFGGSAHQRRLGLIAHSKIVERGSGIAVAEIARAAWRELL